MYDFLKSSMSKATNKLFKGDFFMRQTININKKWLFRKGVASPLPDLDKSWCFVNLPHTYNAIDGQDGGNDYFRGKACYMKKINKVHELPDSESYFLEINAANSSAEVFIDGKSIGKHEGGYSTFRFDITPYVKPSFIITIVTDNSPDESVYPQVADFTFYGGLYRDVNIICVPESHFELEYLGSSGIEVTPTVTKEKADISLFARTKNAEGLKVVFTITDKEKNEIAVVPADKDGHALITIESPHLWHGKADPYLYTAKAELFKDKEVIDCIHTRFGCRFFEISAEKGFILNSHEYALRGVSRHQDRLGVGNALLPEHHREDMELIDELGATTVRLAHYQHDRYFYDLCDEKGIIVWAEIPYISQHNPSANENAILQMKELIAQNYNHPSIIVWGLSNEISMKGDRDPDMLEAHKKLNRLCHETDKTRLTTMAVVSPCPTDSPYLKIPDTVAYNHYFGWYGGEASMNGPWFDKFHKEHPTVPIACSEYGCEGLDWHTSSPVQGDYTEEYQAYYHEQLIKQLYSRKYLWATYVWNMFDFGADARNEGGENGQNHKGLVTFDRKYKKDAFYAYKAWLSKEPFVHICSKRYTDRTEDETTVTVYSNQPEVELFVNSHSLAKKKSDDHFFHFKVPNKAISLITAVAGDYRDESLIRKVDSFNEKYRLKEKGAILNWFDVSEPEGYLSLNSKIKDITATQRGNEIFTDLMRASLAAENEDSSVFAGVMKNESMSAMLGDFTLLRLLNMSGDMLGFKLDKKQLLALNEKLNEVSLK